MAAVSQKKRLAAPARWAFWEYASEPARWAAGWHFPGNPAKKRSPLCGCRIRKTPTMRMQRRETAMTDSQRLTMVPWVDRT
mgnify:CR=1 FL=1